MQGSILVRESILSLNKLNENSIVILSYLITSMYIKLFIRFTYLQDRRCTSNKIKTPNLLLTVYKLFNKELYLVRCYFKTLLVNLTIR